MVPLGSRDKYRNGFLVHYVPGSMDPYTTAITLLIVACSRMLLTSINVTLYKEGQCTEYTARYIRTALQLNPYLELFEDCLMLYTTFNSPLQSSGARNSESCL